MNKFKNRDLVKVDWDANHTSQNIPPSIFNVGVVQHALSDDAGPYCVIIWYKSEADIKKIRSSLYYEPYRLSSRESVLKLYYSTQDKINDLFKDLDSKYGKV